MNIAEAIKKVHAPKGVTSVIAGILSNDFDSIRDQSAVGVSLEAAEAKLAAATEAMNTASSDWSYWGYAGDVAYWECVVSLLKAADLVGADNLPDIPLPDLDGVVMDVQYKVSKWGKDVLAAARRATEGACSDAERSQDGE